MDCFDLIYALLFGRKPSYDCEDFDCDDCGEDDNHPAGSHKHHCEECGFIWEHADTNAGNDAAHTCVCGAEVWTRYYGPLTAMFVGCGRPMKVVTEVVKKTAKKVAKRVKAVCKRKKVRV